jgi:hypothetical protein
METNKSLDEVEIIATLLHDISLMHGAVFNTRAARLTINKVRRRCLKEGLSFLTKTLPKLGKALDKALSTDTPLDCVKLGFKPLPGTQLPRFLGELFQQVLDRSGRPLLEPCVSSVKWLRQVLYLYYKYELPYTADQEQTVLDQFIEAERELTEQTPRFRRLAELLGGIANTRNQCGMCRTDLEIARRARVLLAKVFSNFDASDIVPRHGPGVVATKQRLWEKYQWTNISSRITDLYPLDEFFCSSLGHVCDSFDKFDRLSSKDYPAKVLLVPKDSRGPRLISCEPVDFQWVQQGLREAIYQLVESHPLTRYEIYFTDQVPNQKGALLGSLTGRYATLDLKEASDRVHLDLVRALFPEHVFIALDAARSRSTELPDGRILPLSKYAPMGSALCFPVMALTIWALLRAGLGDASCLSPKYRATGKIHVYGDDVIVPTEQSARAIEVLESFGLKVNRDKSCTNGFFRESCGMDAFKGEPVTPVRLRTVWSSSPSADVYTSWISYANSFYDRRCFGVYDKLVQQLTGVYPVIPSQEQVGLTCPSLRQATDNCMPIRTRFNSRLQRREYRVLVPIAPKVRREISGWEMLLRYFVEGCTSSIVDRTLSPNWLPEGVYQPFSVRSYTRRHTSMLVWRWR